MNKISKFTMFFLLFSIFLYCQKESQPVQSFQVNIQIQLPDGVKTFTEKATNQQTLYDVMKNLQEKNQIQMEVQGSGDLILLVSLNQIKNESSGKNKKNWLYAVNGKLAEVGIAQYKINENLKVDWCYLSWEEKEKCGIVPESLKYELNEGEKK